MKIDFATLSFGYSVREGGATPNWATSLGQGKDYKINDVKEIEELVKGIVYCSVPLSTISTKIGKGGRVVKGDVQNSPIVLGAVFSKVYINNEPIEGGKFIMLITRDTSDSHFGRLRFKYGPSNTYEKDGRVYSNEAFFNLVKRKFSLNDRACWFVSDIRVVEQDTLILKTTIVNAQGPVEYPNVAAQHAAWKALDSELEINIETDKSHIDILDKNVLGMHITKANDSLSEENPHVCIGWSALGDLSTISSKEALGDRYSEVFPEKSVNAKAQDVSQIWAFLDKAKIGDYVVYFDGKKANIGKVTSDYYYLENPQNQDADYTNNKSVEWLKTVEYQDLPKSIRSAGRSARSIFSLNDYRSALLSLLNGEVVDVLEEEELIEGIKEFSFIHRGPRTYKEHPMNMILYGAPGTGKTYATAEYALAIVEHRKVSYAQKTVEERALLMEQYNNLIKEGRILFTTFHQSYGYEDFIQGLRPDTESESMSFKTIDGVFKQIADRAMVDQENDYVLIIDEINRANISKVFGELITLIEEDKRWGELNAVSITLPSGEPFAVPNNLYIVGTMNSADKSISLIDTALRRRFEFIEVTPDYSVVEDEELRTILEKLNKGLADELDSTDLLIGHAYFIGKTMDNLCEIMNRSIIPLLYEYFYDNAKKVKDLVKKAVDGYNYDIQDGKIGRIKLVKKD